MSRRHPSLIRDYRPRSFRERGFAAPFTTPMLSGARLRVTPEATACASERTLLRRGGVNCDATGQFLPLTLEVVVPNPSGARGVYILPWCDVAALCRPTMHDVILVQTLMVQLDLSDAQMSPATMREAARTTATRGLAGRLASNTAGKQARSYAERLESTRLVLLMALTTQIEARTAPGDKLQEQPRQEIERRGKVALTLLALELGRPPQDLADTLDFLAQPYVEIGIGADVAEAPLPRLLESLGSLQNELRIWSQTEGNLGLLSAQSEIRDANSVTGVADLTGRMARRLVQTSRAQLDDMPLLMRAALANSQEIAQRCERASWLLDGWERICLIWQNATTPLAIRSALLDIARQIPLLPDEAEAWLQLPSGTAAQLSQRPQSTVPGWHDPVSHLDRIARNEQIRAMSA